jgi:hypothetical protein
MPFTPYDAGSHCIRRANSLLTAAVRTPASGVAKADMRRLSVVMALAALDTYMHRLVVARALDHGAMPGGLARLSVDFENLVVQAEQATDARRQGRATRPKVAVKRVLRDRLLRETFQRYDDVSRALAMAGRPGHWEAIANAMPGEWTPAQIRDRLNGIVDRRNAIVHEGDYVRRDRPRNAKRTELRTRDARREIRFIRDLIDAIHASI